MIAPNALIVLTADSPMAYLLTRFPMDSRHVGVDNNLIRAERNTPLREHAARVISQHSGPIYQFTPRDTPAERTLTLYGLRRSNQECAEVSSNLDRDPPLLCPLVRDVR